MDNPEKHATHVIEDEEKQNKNNNTICVGHHYTQTNINNVNKNPLQTTEGKDEPHIVFMRKSQRTIQHGTQNVKTYNMTTQKN